MYMLSTSSSAILMIYVPLQISFHSALLSMLRFSISQIPIVHVLLFGTIAAMHNPTSIILSELRCKTGHAGVYIWTYRCRLPNVTALSTFSTTETGKFIYKMHTIYYSQLTPISYRLRLINRDICQGQYGEENFDCYRPQLSAIVPSTVIRRYSPSIFNLGGQLCCSDTKLPW